MLEGLGLGLEGPGLVLEILVLTTSLVFETFWMLDLT